MNDENTHISHTKERDTIQSIRQQQTTTSKSKTNKEEAWEHRIFGITSYSTFFIFQDDFVHSDSRRCDNARSLRERGRVTSTSNLWIGGNRGCSNTFAVAFDLMGDSQGLPFAAIVVRSCSFFSFVLFDRDMRNLVLSQSHILCRYSRIPE